MHSVRFWQVAKIVRIITDKNQFNKRVSLDNHETETNDYVSPKSWRVLYTVKMTFCISRTLLAKQPLNLKLD